ncbi:hypothetical protein N431DRAFT_479578 [Stipitochalara longipes BDJ]|nr:hypothetical protein N431DRAFT_479578 [Stipitochalara longipes BDJ]
MGEEVITCVWNEPHDNNIQDVCLHYFGCVQYERRDNYFQTLGPRDQQLIRSRAERTQKVKEYIKQDRTMIPVLDDLAESLREFRAPTVIVGSTPETLNSKDGESTHRSCDGMFAGIVLFRNAEPHPDPRLPNRQWPNQEIPLETLLYDRSDVSNPLAGAKALSGNDDNWLQWFHLPANNMEWVEEAISRYYGEDRPITESLSRPPSMTRELLRREFWRGQQQGGDLDPAHARHMKPRCDIIPMSQQTAYIP